MAPSPKKAAKAEKPAGLKRPMSAYFLFMNAERENIKRANPDCKVTEVGKIAGEMWRELAPAKKKVYQDKAAALKAAYDKQVKA